MNQDDLYFTSDQAQAAYLCLRGYTLLGAVDTGSERLQFALTHTEYRNDPDTMKKDLLKRLEEFNIAFLFPGDEDGKKISFNDYAFKLRMCNRATKYPVKKESL